MKRTHYIPMVLIACVGWCPCGYCKDKNEAFRVLKERLDSDSDFSIKGMRIDKETKYTKKIYMKPTQAFREEQNAK